MLESLIVYSVTLFLLFFILAIFSVLFQRWNIQTIAHETAARIASTYKLSEADTVTGYATKEQILDVREYRYLYDGKALETAAENKAKVYAPQRLAKTTYTKNVTEPDVHAHAEHDALARRHIEVTVTGEYCVPFGDALSYFGFDSVIRYETKAYAECLDIIDYINTVDYVDYQTSLKELNSGLVEMISKILKVFGHIFLDGGEAYGEGV